MRDVEGYEALVVGARERKVEGRRSSAAGMKFSWPENARESISARVGGDVILFAVRQSVRKELLTADIACRRSFDVEIYEQRIEVAEEVLRNDDFWKVRNMGAEQI